MAKVSRESASQVNDYGPVEERREDVDGTTIQFLTFREDADGTPLMKGLPDDRCHSPHWGYVLKGRFTLRFAGHDEVYEAGDAFYAPPGHVPIVEAGCEYVQFSPTDVLDEISAAMVRNMETLHRA